jgi:hypothetical protein
VITILYTKRTGLPGRAHWIGNLSAWIVAAENECVRPDPPVLVRLVAQLL